MTRRMLKEEKELREYLFGPADPMDVRVLRSMINALVRAVREDCADRATEVLNGAPITLSVREAIRRGK
jgi:hypothetical protein